MLPENKAVSLKTVAARVGLAPCSVSAILNNTDAARAIPQPTKDRVHRAAAELNYRPNFMARSLRTKRTRMVAVVAPGLGRSSVACIVVEAQRKLQRHGYMVVLTTADSDDPNHLCAQFQQRGIEGVISIDADMPPQMKLPVTSLDLGYGTSGGSGETAGDLGDLAAESIMRQIEKPGCGQRLTIQGMPPAFSDMPRMRVAFPSAAENA
jgi:LacI family transcriptional regulator